MTTITRNRNAFDSIDSIRHSGFTGFVSVSVLQSSHCFDVPDKPGVYLVVRAKIARPRFLKESTGGHFKRKNPTVAISRLKSKWLEDALLLYIGKAGPSKGRTIRSRLRAYMQFGQGRAVGHQGGRYIWQLRYSGTLLVCWKATPRSNPRKLEQKLIREFETVYHKLPFANLCH